MTSRLRSALVEVFFAIEENNLRDPACSCRRPIPKSVTPAIREALDKVYAALADEPGPSRGELIETD